jgi:hypothetical protein
MTELRRLHDEVRRLSVELENEKSRPRIVELTNDPLFLSPAEVTELTGRLRPHLQAVWLRERGWCFEVSAIGRPVVSRAYVVSRLGGVEVKRPKFEPRLHHPR